MRTIRFIKLNVDKDDNRMLASRYLFKMEHFPAFQVYTRDSRAKVRSEYFGDDDTELYMFLKDWM